MRRRPSRWLSLAVGVTLLMSGAFFSLQWLFAAGYLTCAVCLVMFARGQDESGKAATLVDTPEMNRLTSDVRERDRALRDGVWVSEYVMRDGASRVPLALIGVVVLAVVLLSPLYLILNNVAATSPFVTTVVVVAGIFGFALLLS